VKKSEDQLISWIAARYPRGDLPIGIGDDMAMLPTQTGLLVTTDMVMDGVDFDSAVHTPEQMGRKALAVNLSDCAAMAVRPRWAVVSVALPNGWSMERAQKLYEGLETLAREFEVQIVGGDTNSWDKPLVISVTVLADLWDGAIQPVRRSGMKPGDSIWVSGRLGGSLAGHHLDFVPRVREARMLAGSLGGRLHAMMDLSDGLSTDGARMAEASGCAIELDEAALIGVASEDARRDGKSIVEHVLNDGEDFELLCAIDATVPRIETPGDWMRIGRAVSGEGVWIVDAQGGRRATESQGWQHFKA
jgi:thiamine-monophosphate kinase